MMENLKLIKHKLIKLLLKAPLSEYFSTSLDHNDRFQDSIMEY